MNFEEAKRTYVNRYTMEHKPLWADKPLPNGKFYAPQYATDLEWFQCTKFPPNNPIAYSSRDKSCFSYDQSWPLGQWLDAPYLVSVRAEEKQSLHKIDKFYMIETYRSRTGSKRGYRIFANDNEYLKDMTERVCDIVKCKFDEIRGVALLDENDYQAPAGMGYLLALHLHNADVVMIKL